MKPHTLLVTIAAIAMLAAPKQHPASCVTTYGAPQDPLFATNLTQINSTYHGTTQYWNEDLIGRLCNHIGDQINKWSLQASAQWSTSDNHKFPL
jgi:hypothetical protein